MECVRFAWRPGAGLEPERAELTNPADLRTGIVRRRGRGEERFHGQRGGPASERAEVARAELAQRASLLFCEQKGVEAGRELGLIGARCALLGLYGPLRP